MTLAAVMAIMKWSNSEKWRRNRPRRVAPSLRKAADFDGGSLYTVLLLVLLVKL
jgi:hypothetical protein